MKGKFLISRMLAQSLFRTNPIAPDVQISTDFNEKLREQRENDMKFPSKRKLNKMKGKKK